ncbi:MAG: hypothetical protein KAH54_04030 [Candidatus Sabulitectum sp.]|nr:hypothetical protein [Candidatus Sabulitectum sp.]
MKSSIVCVILVSLVFGFEWTVLAELPEGSRASGLRECGEGIYAFDLFQETGDTLYRSEITVVLNGSHMVTNREVFILEDHPARDSYVTVPFPDGIESRETFAGISRISASGDTLWTVMLDSLEDRVETGLRIIPCRSGGCFAVFSPTPQDFIWMVYRLSDSGEVLMSGEFQMQGGPILRIAEVVETEDSSFLITGTTDDLGMNLYMFLAGIESDGNQFIDVREDFRFHGEFGNMKLDDSGNIYIAGSTGYERDDGYFMPPQDTDVFLLKLDPQGREIWRTVFEYPMENSPSIVEITSNGEVILAVRSFSYDPQDLSSSNTLLIYRE